MLKGDPADKEYQKTLIDNLVYKVFVYDDHIITYLTFGNEKDIKEISLAAFATVNSSVFLFSLDLLQPPLRLLWQI